MARWVKLSNILVQRAQSWSVEAIELPESRGKLVHVTRVALGGVSSRDRRAMTAVSQGAERLTHDGEDSPSTRCTR